MSRTVLLLLSCFSLSLEAAVTVTLRPDGSTLNAGDAYLISANATGNFGGAGALTAAGSGTAKGAAASLLKFDLASATASFDAAFGTGNWALDSVMIELTSATPNNPNFSANTAGLLELDWVADDSWTESGATWAALPAILSSGTQNMGTFYYAGTAPVTNQYALMATAGFGTDLLSGGVASFLLGAGDSAVSMVINSRNYGVAANRPALILTASAIPEPGRCLLLLGGAAVACLRRKRHLKAPTPRAFCV